MEKRHPVGIVLSDAHVAKIQNIQSALSRHRKYKVSLDDAVYSLLLYEIAPERLTSETRQIFANLGSRYCCILDIVQSSVYLEDYV